MARSFTVPGDPKRCPRCWVIRTHCLCDALPRVQLPFQLVVVRHFLEAEKTTNTARIAALAIPDARLLSFGARGDDPSQLVFPGGALLFPGASPPPASPPRTLVVPDGTWFHCRRMARHVPGLRDLPRITVPPRDSVRLREGPPGGVSTLEAIAAAIELWCGAEAARPRFELHALHVDRVLRARGARPSHTE